MTLYVDLLLPMVAAAGMLLALASIREPRRAALLALPFSVYAYLVKNRGRRHASIISDWAKSMAPSLSVPQRRQKK